MVATQAEKIARKKAEEGGGSSQGLDSCSPEEQEEKGAREQGFQSLQALGLRSKNTMQTLGTEEPGEAVAGGQVGGACSSSLKLKTEHPHATTTCLRPAHSWLWSSSQRPLLSLVWPGLSQGPARAASPPGSTLSALGTQRLGKARKNLKACPESAC